MKTTAKVARIALQSAGVVALAFGLIIWTGDADQLIPAHKALGDVLVLSLWTIAVIAARSGVPRRVVALAVAWGLRLVFLMRRQAGTRGGTP